MKRSPMPRKRKTPRRTLSPRCTVRGCKQIARIDTFCRSHAQREADRLFSLWIRRDGICWAGFPMLNTCAGGLQCCHIISRRYHAVRWEESNAVAMCQAHHVYFTHRPLEWEDAVIRAGIDYANLRYCALNDSPPDLEDVLADLRTKVAA